MSHKNEKSPPMQGTPKGWLSEILRKAAQEEDMAEEQAKPNEVIARPAEKRHTETATASAHGTEPGKGRLLQQKEMTREEEMAPGTSSGPQESAAPRRSIMKRIAGKLHVSSSDFQPRTASSAKKPYQELAHLGEQDSDAGSATTDPSQQRRVASEEPKKKGVDGKKKEKEQGHFKKSSKSHQFVPEASEASSSPDKTHSKGVKLEELPGFENLTTNPYLINYDDPPEDQQWKIDNILHIARNEKWKTAFIWEYRKGSVFDAKEEHILVHSCNCQGFWGKGFALELKQKYPQHYKVYRDHCNEHKVDVEDMLGDMLLLGPHNVDTNDKQLIACLFTRETASKTAGAQDRRRTIDHTDAALNLMQHELRHIGRTEVTDIVMPKINAGLFGIPWEETEKNLKQAVVVERYPTRKIIVYDGKKRRDKNKW